MGICRVSWASDKHLLSWILTRKRYCSYRACVLRMACLVLEFLAACWREHHKVVLLKRLLLLKAILSGQRLLYFNNDGIIRFLGLVLACTCACVSWRTWPFIILELKWRSYPILRLKGAMIRFDVVFGFCLLQLLRVFEVVELSRGHVAHCLLVRAWFRRLLRDWAARHVLRWVALHLQGASFGVNTFLLQLRAYVLVLCFCVFSGLRFFYWGRVIVLFDRKLPWLRRRDPILNFLLVKRWLYASWFKAGVACCWRRSFVLRLTMLDAALV